QNDPFQQGRFIQSALYLFLARARLREKISDKAEVNQFGYFFPNPKEHGERITWNISELEVGEKYISNLCEMMVCGCFPFSDEARDVLYSNYADVFVDAKELAKKVKRKMENTKNEVLEPFRELRGYKKDEA
ncbi:MAG: hypothetical protein V1754_13735, partial [Pseudomonadota bacterium]